MSKVSVTPTPGGGGGDLLNLEGWDFKEAEVVDVTNANIQVRFDLTEYAGTSVGLIVTGDLVKVGNPYLAIRVISVSVKEDGSYYTHVDHGSSSNTRFYFGFSSSVNSTTGKIIPSVVSSYTTSSYPVTYNKETNVFTIPWINATSSARGGRAWLVIAK